jgi:uncharacterized protein (DUF362 family)
MTDAEKPRFHPIYSKGAAVYLETGENKLDAMRRAIEHARFFDNVEAILGQSGKAREEFLIAIKPNIMTAATQEPGSPVYTDPELVECIINELRGRGFREMAVVEARNVFDYSYQARSVKAVADMVGYTSNGYRIADLSAQMEPFDYGGVLGQHYVGRTWRDADYRISFAKNKTHWQCFYTGCLKNIYGCLPQWDKMKHYHGKRREFYQCCILILDAFPVHFGFLDAWVSGDGFSGHVRDADPNVTRMIFASQNIFALDWVMGEKMQLKPTTNYVIQEALRFWHKPEITRAGDMTPWENWMNIRPATVALLDLVEEAYWTSRFFSRAFASQQDERFPPASRWEKLFRLIHAITRVIEPVLIKAADESGHLPHRRCG